MVEAIETAAQLKKRLSEAGDKLVVIDFYATWCGPCRMIAPQYIKLAESYPDILFLKFDIDTEGEVGDEYNITSLPTFLVFKNGEILNRFSGANIQKIEEMIEALK